MKIVKGQYLPIPSHYSEALVDMVKNLLTKDYRQRPAIADIISMSSMKARMQQFGYNDDISGNLIDNVA
jgi:NIMA (never in mitosis gene a)-related kinase